MQAIVDTSNEPQRCGPLARLLSSITNLFVKKQRKCLVLDLDETLVHSSFDYVENADFVIPIEIGTKIQQVYVLKRPGVDEFLKKMGQVFEVVVFTASVAKYADAVLDLLDVSNSVHHRLFRESCVYHQGVYVKDLEILGRDLKSIAIVDNSHHSYAFNVSNGIPISSWFDDLEDKALDSLTTLLLEMKESDDFREFLNQKRPFLIN